MKMYLKCTLILGFLFTNLGSYAQENSPFLDEVLAIQKKYDSLWDKNKETIVFTGSSSVRMWHDLQERFPNQQIVNSGFGGSQASDLLQFTDELITQYHPKKVFIYEGDNDISAGKKSKEIITDIQQIIAKIKSNNAAIKVILISAKPSISRWNLKRKYKRLNRKFTKMSRKEVGITYVDVWKPMLIGKRLNKTIFIEDGLHMNTEGYDIWYDTLKPLMD